MENSGVTILMSADGLAYSNPIKKAKNLNHHLASNGVWHQWDNRQYWTTLRKYLAEWRPHNVGFWEKHESTLFYQTLLEHANILYLFMKKGTQTGQKTHRFTYISFMQLSLKYNY